MQDSDKTYDVIIIGAGPAGLTAATYTSRALLKTLLLEKLGAGGQLSSTESIENYPGFPDGINGYELSMKMEEQAKRFGTEIEYNEVQHVKKGEDGMFDVMLEDTTYRARAVLVATGVAPRVLDVPGEKDFIGRGVSFCATCDAAFYRNKTAAVIGGGDSALEEAMFLTKFADKVYIVHRRDALRATKIVQQRAFANEKIEFVWDSVVTAVLGEQSVNAIKVKNVKTNEETELAVNGMFLYVGGVPSKLGLGEVETSPRGFIITDDLMRTSIPGLFAVGDAREKSFRQVSTAVGDGAQAANSIEKYLEE